MCIRYLKIIITVYLVIITGLFKKAIMQSGTALCPWSLSTTAKQAAYKIGENLNINPQDSKELVEKLKNIPAADLQRISIVVMGAVNLTYLKIIMRLHIFLFYRF